MKPTISWVRSPGVRVGFWFVVHSDRTWVIDAALWRRRVRLASPGYEY